MTKPPTVSDAPTHRHVGQGPPIPWIGHGASGQTDPAGGGPIREEEMTWQTAIVLLTLAALVMVAGIWRME